MKKNYTVGIYCRLSKDDNLPGESMSIGTQKSILLEYCRSNNYDVFDTYTDDGVSGLTFNRPEFQRLIKDINSGAINMVLTKDLSRLGRDYIMTGYYTEIFFPSKNVRYIALSDGFDTANGENDVAPFKNILNDMYARDISRKVKNAKRQRAKMGLYISGQAPYGYMPDASNKGHLIIDPPAAQNVRIIFNLALEGRGDTAIAQELKRREIIKPSVYKHMNGDTRFARYNEMAAGTPYDWCPATIRKILGDKVYLGNMVNHRVEVINYKTKARHLVPEDEQIVIENTHEAIITKPEFEQIKLLRSQRFCPARSSRENIFRGLLYCSCCGHPLSIAHRKLVKKEDDLYRCMRHYYRPDECPQTHAIYHEELEMFVLEELRALAKSMKRRKIHSPITRYVALKRLDAEVLNTVIERIELKHVSKSSKIENAVQIYWRI